MAQKYQVGDVVDGYEFIGGDYRDRTNWKDWGQGARKMPDGSIVRDGPKGGLQFLRKAPSGEGGGRLRDFEITAAGRATLMDEGQQEYERARRDGYDPGSWKNGVAMALEGVPVVGRWGADVIRDNPSERGRVAELQFTEGALRTTTGANAPDAEVRNASRMYFRQPGESQGVEYNKQLARDRFRNTAVRAAGSAYIPRTPTQGDGGARNAASALPQPALQAYRKRFSGMDMKAPRGTQANPYLARDAATLERLPTGSYVIAPNGDFGVID